MTQQHRAGSSRQGLGVVDGVLLGLGSVIGAGLFVASGVAVRQAGPAVLIAYVIGGVALVGVLSGLAEMAAANPAPGGLRTYAREAFGPWLGFTVGWMYWTSGVLTMSSEVTAAALMAHTWFPHSPLWVLSLVFSAGVGGINSLGVRRFGKVEDALAVVKVLALVAFVAIGGYFLLRGVGTGLDTIRSEGVGLGRLFPTGWRGLGASMLMVMFSYAGVQVVAMAASDTQDPARTFPRIIKALTLSVLVLYLSAFVVLLLVMPWNQVNTGSSPFVQALQRLGLRRVDQIFTFVILTAALSSLNSALYGVSRMLYGLARDGEAPGVFVRLTRSGIPGWALAGSSLVLVAAILVAYWLPRQAYLLITSASGFVSMFNWLVVALGHLRYRQILLRRNPGGLVYRAWGYPYLSLVTAGITAGVLLTTPLAPGQVVGLGVGVVMFCLVSLAYLLVIRPRRLARKK